MPTAEPQQQMEMRELVTIRQFRDLPEALLAKGSLESAGIECFLADDNLVRLDWFISNFIGGIKLNVRAADAANAQKLLDEPILEGLYVQGVGLYEQPRCPKCQSLDVNFQELDRPIAYMSAFLRVPIPVQRPGWRCHGCDAEWEDDGAGGRESHNTGDFRRVGRRTIENIKLGIPGWCDSQRRRRIPLCGVGEAQFRKHTGCGIRTPVGDVHSLAACWNGASNRRLILG